MTLVAIETSTQRPSIAIWSEGRCLQAWLSGSQSHARDLMPSLSSLLKQLGRTPLDIRGVVVGRGPGSYTGLRVGAATALGIARGANASLGGLSSFEALAFAQLESGEDGVVLVDARADEIYWAHLARTERDVKWIRAPEVARADAVGAQLPSSAPIFCARGVEQTAKLTEEQRARCRFDLAPEAAALLQIALERGAELEQEIEPLYLRAFAAKVRRV